MARRPAAMPEGEDSGDVRRYMAFQAFSTMDTQMTREGMPPDRLAWCENLHPVAPNVMRSVPGPGPAIATLGSPVYRIFEAHLRGALYLIAYTRDGAGWQVNEDTGSKVRFAPPGTFSDPDTTVYAAQRILIADPQAGYCTWDTVVFVRQGGCSPNIVITNGGSGYSEPPAVVISGLDGAKARAEVTNGSVTKVVLTDPGHGALPDTKITITFVNSGTGGRDAAAKAAPWPYLGFTPNSVAIFQGHVWVSGAGRDFPIDQARILAYSGTIAAAAPEGIDYYDNFDPAATAGQTVIADNDLMAGITALRSLGNFLYIFGDYSVKQIGSVSIQAGTPPLLTFTITTVTSDQGTRWRDSIISYNKLPMFANPSGIWALFGASLEKISAPMDGIFERADFSVIQPQAATFDLYGQHCCAYLIRFYDSALSKWRNILMALKDQSWFLLSKEGDSIRSIAGVSENSASELVISDDGELLNLHKDMFAEVNVRLSTSLWHDGKPMSSKRALRAGLSQEGVTLLESLTWGQESENESVPSLFQSGGAVIWENASSKTVIWANAQQKEVDFYVPSYQWKPLQVYASGVYLGGTLSGKTSALKLSGIVIEYEDSTQMRSSNVAR